MTVIKYAQYFKSHIKEWELFTGSLVADNTAHSLKNIAWVDNDAKPALANLQVTSNSFFITLYYDFQGSQIALMKHCQNDICFIN